MKTYYLYSLNDPRTNSPRYIGITCNLEQRLKEHLSDLSITKKTNWIKNLAEQGITPTIQKLKESDNVHEIIAFEIEYIAKYRVKWNLVNSTKGGEYYAIGLPVDCYNLKGEYITTYSSMIEASGGLKNYSSISAVCERKRNYAFGKIWRYCNDPVTKEDLERLNKSLSKRKFNKVYIISFDGKILEEFPSITAAGKSGKWGSISNLRCAMIGDNGYGPFFLINGNFVCSSLEDFKIKKNKYKNAPLKKDTRKKAILQFDLNGNFLKEYESAYSAAKQFGKCSSSISKCCMNQQNTAYEYKWKYK